MAPGQVQCLCTEVHQSSIMSAPVSCSALSVSIELAAVADEFSRGFCAAGECAVTCLVGSGIDNVNEDPPAALEVDA